MVGVLPAFQGNVPIQLKALYNDSNITAHGDTGWLDSVDPLFLRIANLWMSQLIEDFGTDHYYQLGVLLLSLLTNLLSFLLLHDLI